MTPAEILRAAADLIEPEGKWTQGQYARDEFGNSTNFEGPEAMTYPPRVYAVLKNIIDKHGVQLQEILQSKHDGGRQGVTEETKALREAIHSLRALEPRPSTTQIGRWLNRHHTTILHHLRREP